MTSRQKSQADWNITVRSDRSRNFLPIHQQQQQIFPAIDLNLAPQWEINFGLGVGLTGSTDHLIVKGIIGYRFDF